MKKPTGRPPFTLNDEQLAFVKKLAGIGLTEHQIASVSGIDFETLNADFTDIIQDALPPDYMKRRWMRFARFDPQAASEARRLYAAHAKATPSKRVKASVTTQIYVIMGRAGAPKKSNLFARLAYDRHELAEHLQAQFRNGMCWDNYGIWWEIDHRKPVSWFGVTEYTDKQINEIWSLSNLQPLLKSENRAKSNRWSDA